MFKCRCICTNKIMIVSRFNLVASRLQSVNVNTHLISLLVIKRNMSLISNKNLVNGQWISAENHEQVAVLNPVNSALVGQVPDLTSKEVQKAIDSAYDAFHADEWSNLTAKERSALLKVSEKIIYG